MKKVLLGAALVAAVLVPAASASNSHRVKLSLVALPKSALGRAGKPLAVTPDSGTVSNDEAAADSNGGAPNTFSKLGRVTGYTLKYGDRFSGRAGVTEITTSVDAYKTGADARRGLAFWQKDDPKITIFAPYGLPFAVKSLTAAKVGTHRFAKGTTLTIPNAAPLALVDDQFTDGRYVLQVDVAAGSLSSAAGVAGKLARRLDRRLRLAEAGKLHGKPVKLPKPLKAGPPANGPDLATLALTPTDLGGQATLGDHGYEPPSTPSLSEYAEDLQPAGSYDELSQLVDWFPTANDALDLSRFEGGAFAYLLASGLLTGTPGQLTQVDLSVAGDNAWGGTVSVTPQGQPTVYFAIISLSSGQASALVLASSQSQIQPADVVSLAQAAANRLNAGLSG